MNRVVLFVAPFALFALWTITASWVTVYGLGMGPSIPYPSWQWWGYLMAPMPDAVTAAFVERWLSNGALAASAFTLLAGFRLVTKFGLGISKRALHGESKFGTVEEGRRVGLIYSRHPRPDCLILGRTKGLLFGLFARYVCMPDSAHVLLYAMTRSGKGVSYVVPNCFNYEDSLVVLDIKGENHRATATHRQDTGQEVFLFAPMASDGHSHCWNPLAGVTSADPDYLNRLHSIAYDFFPVVPDPKTEFWQGKARNAFYGISAMLAETPSAVLNPGEVFRYFVRGDASLHLAQAIADNRAGGIRHSQVCINLISDFLAGIEEIVSGTRNHVTSAMGAWFNPVVVAATSRSDFDLADLRRRKMTIYVAVEPADLPKLSSVLRLFFLRLLAANMKGVPGVDEGIGNRCHVLLDEFMALGPMRPISDAVAYSIGFGLHFSFVVQSKAQIAEKYKGQGQADLFGNMGAEIVFGTNDQQICKEVSERAGYDTVTATSRTAPRFMSWWRRKEQNETEHQHRRALLLAQEVERMSPDMELVFRKTSPPFLLRRLTWHKDQNFRGLEAPPPEAPPLQCVLEMDDGTVQVGS
jgi:type IV secretion system protein VirD4